jgi:hypothetical protein
VGIILHGSRSGLARSAAAEYAATVRYAGNGAGGLAWNVTLGPGAYTVHVPANRWGWNAREHSRHYLAVEFSQARPGDAIGDDQITAFAAWYRAEVAPVWPRLIDDLVRPGGLVEHHELPAGRRDGKSDVDPARPGELARRCWEEVLGVSS